MYRPLTNILFFHLFIYLYLQNTKQFVLFFIQISKYLTY